MRGEPRIGAPSAGEEQPEVPTAIATGNRRNVYYQNLDSSPDEEKKKESVKIQLATEGDYSNCKTTRGFQPRLQLNVLYNKLLNTMTHLKVLMAMAAFLLVATGCAALTTNSSLGHPANGLDRLHPITKSAMGADLSLVSPGDLLLSLASGSTPHIRRQQQVQALQRYSAEFGSSSGSDGPSHEAKVAPGGSRRSPERLFRRHAPEPGPGERQVPLDVARLTPSGAKVTPVYVSAPKQVSQEEVARELAHQNKPESSAAKVRGSHVQLRHVNMQQAEPMKKSGARHMEASKKKKKKMKKMKKVKKHKKMKKVKKHKKMKKEKKMKKVKKEKKMKKIKKKKKKKKSGSKKFVKKVVYKKKVKKETTSKKKTEVKKKKRKEAPVEHHHHHEEQPVHPHGHHEGGHQQQQHTEPSGKYYEYRSVPKKGAWEFGYKRGNSKHKIERKEHGHKSHFKTEVKWADKKSKGKGHHLWDYNHFDHHKHQGKGHHETAEKPKKKKKSGGGGEAAAASAPSPLTHSSGSNNNNTNNNLLPLGKPW